MRPTWRERDYDGLDPGIREIVKILRANGIETFESCQGGDGHAFADPTVRFHGTFEAGWRALSICFAHGLRVLTINRSWDILDANEPTGPYWVLVLREAAKPRAKARRRK